MPGIYVGTPYAQDSENINPYSGGGDAFTPVRNRGSQASLGTAVPRGSSIPSPQPDLSQPSYQPPQWSQPTPQPAAPAAPQPVQPQPQEPVVGGIMPAGAGGGTNIPAGGGSPAMAGLSQVASGEGFREGFMREGWGDQGTPDLTVPGQRNLPASSRALAGLVSQKGKAY